MKEAVKAIIMNKNDEILIVKSHRWSLPGGRVEENESHDLALMRELIEECGYKLAISVRLIKVWTFVKEGYINYMYLGAYNGVVVSRNEIVDHRWISLSDIFEDEFALDYWYELFATMLSG